MIPNARRIGLSIKAANPKPPKPKREPRTDEPMTYTDPGPEGVTIGDMVEGLSQLGEMLEEARNEPGGPVADSSGCARRQTAAFAA